MLTSICLFMLKQRPAEICHNLRKLCGDYLTFSPQTQGKNMLFFLKPSQGSIPLYIKNKKHPNGWLCFLEQMRGIEPPL